ncbi:hypothetical protein [Asanoa ferruginea]|uniref:hypothetical protein n=1 Tax=Asanoa ferruginea TaxID=53367 RepID=UPI000E23DE82|nr:hypothetical protein [Asanoa ferruginea]
MLNLDEPSAPRVRHRSFAGRLFAPRIGIPQFIAALVVSVAVAVTATHTLESRRRQAADNAHVALTALVGPVESGGRNGRTVTLRATLTVVNTGPAAVVLEEVTGTIGGLTFRSDRSATIRPGVRRVAVTVTIDCVKGIPTEPVEAVMNVETADGQARVASPLMVVQGTLWAEASEQMCRSFSHPGDRPVP